MSDPVASALPTRHTPLRSSVAVFTMCTVEFGSSTQSTGTSWIRSPARSASTSISVSKNHPVSSTSGSSTWATSLRIALNPHCASEKRAWSEPRRIRLYARLMNSRLVPRTTREERASREPIARSE